MSRIAAIALLALPLFAGEAGEPVAPARVEIAPEVPSPARNPTTDAGVELGERLFFDPRLSGNDSIACATCHRPELAFSDGHVRSVGISGEPLMRHTPALVDLAWHDGYFWDGGAKDLESQVFGPLTSPDEMGQDLRALLAELRADPEYVALFDRAFDDGITLANVARAIAQYERTLVSLDSRWDRHARGEPNGALTASERAGQAAFQRACGSCHPLGRFTDHGYHDTGLEPSPSDAHERLAWGRGRITNDRDDIGKYKTPSLRNVAITAPYMHDGRFATLDDVVVHYRSGAMEIDLDDAEARDIVSFLHTLTDRRFLATR